MKRFVCLLLIVLTFFLYGCEIPVRELGTQGEDSTVHQDSRGEYENDVTAKGKEETVGQENPPDVPRVPIILYYQDADGYVTPVTRRIGKQEGIARATVNGLIDSSASREEIEYYGLYPVLPKGTKILGLTIRDGTAIIDFNGQILDYDSERAERNIISSVVYTLTEFKTVQGVKFLINGYTMDKLKFGTDVSGILSRENILINSSKINLKQGMMKYDVCYIKNYNNQFSYVIPVSKEGSGIKSDNLPAKIVEVLSKETGDDNLHSELPDGTRLLGSTLKDGILTLNFNGEMSNYGGNAREEGIVKQVLYSMKQIIGVNAVKITIDGKDEYLPEGTDISEAIAIPGFINDYIDKTNSMQQN